MQKNYVKYNVLMALAILFAICYQSLHIFTDEAHHFHDAVTQEDTSKTQVSADTQTDCPVCDFQFAAFLSTEIFTFDFINPQHKFHFSNTYESIVKEKEFLYFSHRGPPVV
ncbi:hypothetical protein G6N05_12515 [Flavobacterium sp. F372]|uniref:DUF2946 domain-containing protein n=1 Tax=Flavobacterium bernardetii TaxID=2813823 RepID=A0ABR7J0K1_9FLAO|nr:hypothetical protein [Flavobacterium bernardetii]MBC5835570.1 hypothetical protein [Flavobacterium bernardetii]NHF70934.1 hypothetical protein [Flavobacterium bernardetii]